MPLLFLFVVVEIRLRKVHVALKSQGVVIDCPDRSTVRGESGNNTRQELAEKLPKRHPLPGKLSTLLHKNSDLLFGFFESSVFPCRAIRTFKPKQRAAAGARGIASILRRFYDDSIAAYSASMPFAFRCP